MPTNRIGEVCFHQMGPTAPVQIRLADDRVKPMGARSARIASSGFEQTDNRARFVRTR
jgi:hypothetical protein